ncbi:MAG: PSD1 and planctomycete cytochrome C domain-containing protein [Fimbriimonadaceae bacterium]|nr:PSD1 domain-containing protein [Chthonomonadaceae bacterium]MCO5297245.1 PSD1 and planctomycete cytochrome C domain-containing protein [Fimbriimonadaceae bacterium]
MSLAVFGVLGLAVPSQTPQSPSQVGFADVQSLFKARCIGCHGAASPSGGLALDSFEGVMRGGATGPAVVAGKPDASLLIQRVKGTDGKPQMPLGFAPLGATEIATLERWIAAGCPNQVAAGPQHWAYVAPVRPSLPPVKTPGWVRNPIDAFVLARLEREGLKTSPETDRATLIRRVTLDLTGLPPTLAEVDAFLADASPGAYEKVVDRLLASPHYGEKMALPWLDAARYADSNGFQMEGDTYQYVWRDWVVRAMNANMPFDRFTLLQIAGDLMPGATQATPEGRDMLIATGFNRNPMLNGEGGAIAEEQRNVLLFDRVDTTSTTWLGITMACARCHDHKYDPFKQRDYYKLLAYFNNVPESGVPEGGVPYSIAKPWIYAGTPEQMRRLHALEAQSAAAANLAAWMERAPETRRAEAEWLSGASSDNGLPEEIRNVLAVKDRSPEQAKKLHAYFMDHGLAGESKARWEKAKALKAELAALKAALPRPMVMSDQQPRVTHIYSRGDYTSPMDEVACGTPEPLPPAKGDVPPNRLGLARWIVSRDNPLTARVQVNRYWQTFFGHGLVRTPENFGVQGEPPTHPELLDWLAVEFMESGWDVKAMHRLIVTSATYCQSSKLRPDLQQRDPSNALLARGARFRLPAMLLRDEALAASGLIDLRMGGKPVYPYQPTGIWDGLGITDERDFRYPQSKGADLYRRSLYTFWRRTAAPGNMFDAASRQVCTVRMSQTSTPLHALTTLNDTTWVEAGRALAQRVMLAEKDRQKRLALAFRLVCARTPDAQEMAVLNRGVQRGLDYYRAHPDEAAHYLSQGDSVRDSRLAAPEHAAYAAVCLSILNLDEALTKE